MKKSSLGRRRSSAVNSQQRINNFGCETLRKSGIPIRSRPVSADRSILMLSAVKPRSRSAHEESTPQFHNSNLPKMGVRPSRNFTMSVDSSRISSIGGSRTRKDSRPLQDKEWQMMADKYICSYFSNVPEGASMIPGPSIRNMTLNLFVEMVDFLMKKLDPLCEINKVNYKQELPFLLKKMHYRGKVDKSWLTTVNVPHVWPNVLGVLHFLVDCIKCCETTDGYELLFPEEFDKEDDEEEELLTPKETLQFFLESYEMYVNDHYVCEEFIDLQVQKMKEQLFSNEFLASIEYLEREVYDLEIRCQKTSDELIKGIEKTQVLEGILYDLQSRKSQELDYQREQKICLDRENEVLLDLKKKKNDSEESKKTLMEKKESLTVALKAKEISPKEIEVMNSKRATLDTAIAEQNKKIETYSDLLFEEDVVLVDHKKKFNELSRELDVSIASCIGFEPELEKFKIDGSMPLKEIDGVFLTFDEKITSLKNVYSKSVEDLEQKYKNKTQKLLQLKEKKEKGKLLLENKRTSLERLQKDRLKNSHQTTSEIDSLEKESLDIDNNYNDIEKKLNAINDSLSNLEEKKEKMDHVKKELEIRCQTIEKQNKELFENQALEKQLNIGLQEACKRVISHFD